MISSPLKVMFDDAISSRRLEYIRPVLDRYGLAFADSQNSISGMTLVIRETDICLIDTELNDRAAVSIDFTRGATDHRRRFGGGKSQMLARAVGLDQKKDLCVVDVTAGLAGDSFVLASLGANVLMLERHPALSLMIDEALASGSQYAEENDEFLADIIRQMQLLHVDAITWLGQQNEASRDVVYLDPMFPERKKKAAVKKEMQLLQTLLEEDMRNSESEERELLEQARRVSIFRVVIKRPRHAPPLAGEKPGYSLEGKSTRFDIYPKRAISRAVS